MKKVKSIIALMGVCMLLFSFRNNINTNTNSDNLEEIKIGTQTWATKNLDVSTFRNGDIIPEAKTNEEWIAAGDSGKPAWCYYNDPENEKLYGKLYNWYTVNDSRGLAPKGWHIPSDSEWTILTDYLGGKAVAGTKMKSTSGWNDFDGKAGNGTNASGFAGLPGGCYIDDGRFGFIGSQGFYWSSSEDDTNDAWFRSLGNHNGIVFRYNDNKEVGCSVRCLLRD